MATVRSNDLQVSSLLSDEHADTDPMASLGNLMDTMLVFACGIIVALIAHYGVELGSKEPDVTNMEALDGHLSSVTDPGFTSSEATFTELGTVYQDDTTGELYVLAPNIDALLNDEE
jgi:hypothetical protein